MNTPAPFSPAFRRLAWSNLAAQSAEQLGQAAAPIVAVLAFQAGAREIGLLAAAQTLPFLLLSIPLGLVADRLPRARVMLVCEVLRVLSLLLLLAGWLGGWLTLPLMAVLGFAGAVGTVGYSVAAPALVPQLVGREGLARANGRLELARSAAYAGGPALAGSLVAWTGAGSAFVVAAVLSAAAALLLFGMGDREQPPAAASHPWHALVEGGRAVWHEPLLRAIVLTALVWNVSWFVLNAAYVPYAMRQLGLGAQAVGSTLAAYGVGMVLGALAAPRIVARMPYGRAVQFGPMVSVAAMATMVASLFVPGVLLPTVSFLLFGFGPIVWTITSTTLRQTITPAALLARVSAVLLTANAGARPIGAALGGWVGGRWGEAACLWLALAGFGLQAALILLSPLRRLRELPAHA
jgi:predicted MFS family arabinose efflux permease